MKRAHAFSCVCIVLALSPPAALLAADAAPAAAAAASAASAEESLHPVHSSLTLAQASRIVDNALAAARKNKMLPMSVVVLDAGSRLVAFKREDGSANQRFEIARGKAAAALGMGMSSRLIRDRLATRPAFQSAIAAASDGQFIPVPGGVLVLDASGVAIGAVGISGDTSDRDEYCGITAVLAAGLHSDPDAPNPDWNKSQL
jgi:glc operon protein GlcG